MATKRRLVDMYKVEKEVTFDDGKGDPVTVLVRKMNPIDHQNALRYANAARSRAASLKNRPDDDEYQNQWSIMLDYDRESLTRYLVEDFRLTKSQVVEAELASEDEWSKDQYLEGLQHAWMDGLKDTYVLEPDDPDAVRTLQELERFSNALDEIVQAAVDDFEDDLDKKDEDELRKMVFEKILTSYASVAWLQEMHRCEIAFATRTENGKERYFKNRDEVSECPVEVYQKLQETYQEIKVEVQEGKDSRETEDSSPSSEQPEKLETDEDSGPEDAKE